MAEACGGLLNVSFRLSYIFDQMRNVGRCDKHVPGPSLSDMAAKASVERLSYIHGACRLERWLFCCYRGTVRWSRLITANRQLPGTACVAQTLVRGTDGRTDGICRNDRPMMDDLSRHQYTVCRSLCCTDGKSIWIDLRRLSFRFGTIGGSVTDCCWQISTLTY